MTQYDKIKSDNPADYTYRCTDIVYDDLIGAYRSHCGSCRRIGSEFFCPDRYGRYCPDYCNGRCGSAKKIKKKGNNERLS
jgi:hypothetical protein